MRLALGSEKGSTPFELSTWLSLSLSKGSVFGSRLNINLAGFRWCLKTQESTAYEIGRRLF